MNIFVVIKENPFRKSSASANRWISLLEGLQNFDVNLYILIYGGYRSRKEKDEMGMTGQIQKIRYEYIIQNVYEGYWKTRIHAYFGDNINQEKILRQLKKRLSGQRGICWVDATLFGFKLPTNLKHEIGLKFFLELSEYLDIYKEAKGSAFYKIKGRIKERYFNVKGFHTLDGLALMTETLMRHFESFQRPGPKLIHLPMTVDMERFEAKFDPLKGFDLPYIAFVGVMNNAKEGVDILIDAFYSIADHFKSYKLYLVGPWHYDTPGHLDQIKRLGLESRVIWKGPYEREKVPAILSNADLLVLPRPSSKQASGGFPTKLGEYLATGKPVCATTVGEIPDYLEDNKTVYFAQPDSVKSFSEALDRALRNKEKSFQVGIGGKGVAQQHFSKEVQSARLFKYFKNLVE